MSDAVLHAAEAALPPDPASYYADPTAIRRQGRKNASLVCLLGALLDAAEAVAGAITDNAFDDSHPVDREFVRDLGRQAQKIALVIETAGDAPDERLAVVLS